MNSAHFHLLINHVPVFGALFGFLFLFFGIVRNNKNLQQAALVTIIITTIVTFSVSSSGEGAEEIVEHIPGVEHKYIHAHEEIAEKGQFVMIVLGLFAAAGLYFIYKQHRFQKIILTITLILSVVVVGFMSFVAKTGGEIRHQEIRDGYKPANVDDEGK